jgi:hypothetical protein
MRQEILVEKRKGDKIVCIVRDYTTSLSVKYGLDSFTFHINVDDDILELIQNVLYEYFKNKKGD